MKNYDFLKCAALLAVSLSALFGQSVYGYTSYEIYRSMHKNATNLAEYLSISQPLSRDDKRAIERDIYASPNLLEHVHEETGNNLLHILINKFRDVHSDNDKAILAVLLRFIAFEATQKGKQHVLSARNKEGRSPLEVAIQNGLIDQAHILLDAGANPRQQDPLPDGQLPTLLHAVKLAFDEEERAIELVDKLLEKGYNVEVENPDGNTLHHIFLSKNKIIFPDDNETELQEGLIAMLERVIKRNPNITQAKDKANYAGYTPLMQAITSCEEEDIPLIGVLAKHSDPRVQRSNNQNVFHIAASGPFGQRTIPALLSNMKPAEVAQALQQQSYGKTPLEALQANNGSAELIAQVEQAAQGIPPETATPPSPGDAPTAGPPPAPLPAKTDSVKSTPTSPTPPQTLTNGNGNGKDDPPSRNDGEWSPTKKAAIYGGAGALSIAAAIAIHRWWKKRKEKQQFGKPKPKPLGALNDAEVPDVYWGI